MRRQLTILLSTIGVILSVAFLLTSTSVYALSPLPGPGPAPTVSASATIKVLPGILTLSSTEVYFRSFGLTGLLFRADPNTNFLVITDGSGSGLGWHVTMKSEDFLCANQRSLNADGFFVQIAPEDIVPLAGKNPTQAFDGDLYLSRVPRVIVFATPDNGMGAFRTKAELSLLLPANTYAGRYKGEFEVIAISSP